MGNLTTRKVRLRGWIPVWMYVGMFLIGGFLLAIPSGRVPLLVMMLATALVPATLRSTGFRIASAVMAAIAVGLICREVSLAKRLDHRMKALKQVGAETEEVPTATHENEERPR